MFRYYHSIIASNQGGNSSNSSLFKVAVGISIAKQEGEYHLEEVHLVLIGVVVVVIIAISFVHFPFVI